MTKAPELDPTRGFRGGAHLRLVRVQGSWRGRFAHPVERAELLSGARALVETREREGKGRVWVADLRTGTRALKSDWSVPLRAGLQAKIAEGARKRNRLEGRVSERAIELVCDTGAGPDGPESWPRYALARVRHKGRAHAAVFECATGRERVRFGARRAAGFSSCGAFCVYVSLDGALIVVRLEDLAQRRVSVAWAGAPVGEALVRGDADAWPVELVARVRSRKGHALQCVSLGDGATKWTRPATADESPLGVAERAGLAWTATRAGTLRAYSFADGGVAQQWSTGAPARAGRVARDGSYALLVGRNCLAGVDLASGETQRTDEGPDADVQCLAWDRSGTRYAVLYGSGELHVRAHPGGALVASAEAEGAVAGERFVDLAFEPGSTRVLFGRVREGGSYLERLDYAESVSLGRAFVSARSLAAVDLSPEGSCAWLTTWRDDSGKAAALRDVVLWSLEGARVLASPRPVVMTAADFVGFDPEPASGELCATATSTIGWRRTQLSLTGAWRDVISLEAGTEDVPACTATATNADRSMVIGVDERRVTFVLTSKKDGGYRYQTVFAAGIDRALCAGAELYAFVTNFESEVELHSAATESMLETLSLKSADDEPAALALAPDGGALLVGTSAGVLIEYAVKR